MRRDTLSPEERSVRMSLIRSRGNKSTEIALARAFRRKGIRGWRRGVRMLGNPDFVFRAHRVTVFVDGCFWHGCRWHRRLPRGSRTYWRKKILLNQRRDARVNRHLRQDGWIVVRVWEHDVRNGTAEKRVARALEVQ